MPTVDPASPIAGYYYDSATDKLRPIAGQPGPAGPIGPAGPTGPQGPGGLIGGYWSGTIGGWTFGTTVVTAAPNTPTISNGFTKIGTGILRCDIAGLYKMTGAFTFGGPTAWVIVQFVHWRGGVQQAIYSWVCGVSTTGFDMATAVAEFNMAVGDTFEIWVNGSGAGINFDGRSTLVIAPVTGVGPAGPQGPAGSLGTAVLNDLNDVTMGTPATPQVLAYDGAGQWRNQYKYGVLHRGNVSMDLGSQTVGGLRDLCTTTIPIQTVSCYVQVWGFVQFGFGGSGPTTCSYDLIRARDGGLYDACVGNAVAPAGGTIRNMILANDVAAAGVNPNVKSRINGLNFSGGNCYMSSALHWIVTET